ncbi:MAG: FkbM family methyltransferase [Verrucomicrobiota bacterium]|nr:FkbM family methyltransferase [Verrucomicrobiota bacterium]
MFQFSKRETPGVIVDIGANIGIFSKMATVLFPEAKIYSYEPHPSAFACLKKNAEGTGISPFNCGVSNMAGQFFLEANCDSTTGAVSVSGGIPVKCISVSELQPETGEIDLLKMDCEGSEWAIFQDSGLLARTKYLTMEYHLVDGHTLKELEQILVNARHRILHVHPHGGYGGKFGLLWAVREGNLPGPWTF